jgi:hypothetical protein
VGTRSYRAEAAFAAVVEVKPQAPATRLESRPEDVLIDGGSDRDDGALLGARRK